MKPALVRDLHDGDRHETLGPHFLEPPPSSLVCPYCERALDLERRTCPDCRVAIPEITDRAPARIPAPTPRRVEQDFWVLVWVFVTLGSSIAVTVPFAEDILFNLVPMGVAVALALGGLTWHLLSRRA